MNIKRIKLLAELYQKYIAVGGIILLSAWAAALLTATFLPGPYTFDLFGVVVERSGDNSSVSINSLAIAVALIIVPLILMVVDLVKRKA